MTFLDEYFISRMVTPEQMDALWARGWRHFGTYFFRYERQWRGGDLNTVMPLRVDLERFAPSRSQRRIIARNRAAEISIGPAFIDRETEELFELHARRFEENVPDSIYTFFSLSPASVPCRNDVIRVSLGGRLVAASFLDVGSISTSAVYAVFDPAHSRRSLGIYTMLEAIRHSQRLGRRYYYPGYAFREPSFYDYKKNFAGLEYLDWHAGWKRLKNDERGAKNDE